MVMGTIFILVPVGSYLNGIGETKSYSESDKYKSRYNDLIHNITEYYVELKTEENILNMEETLRKEKILNFYGITEGTDSAEEEVIDGDFIKEEVNSEIENKLNRFYRITKKLESNVNFLYYIENPETEEVYTNLQKKSPIEYLQKQDHYVYYDQHRADNDDEFAYNQDILRMLSGTEYKVHTAVYKSLHMGDEFFTECTQFNKQFSIYSEMRGVFIVTAIVFILSFGVLVTIIGKGSQGNLIPQKSGQVYNEIQIIVALIVILISSYMVDFMYTLGLESIVPKMYREELLIVLILNVFLLLGLSFLKQLKNKSLLSNTIMGNLFKAFFQTKFIFGIIAFLVGYVVLNGIIVLIMFSSGNGLIALITFLALIIFNVVVFLYIQRNFVSFEKIMNVTREYSHGNYAKQYDVKDISIPFQSFYEDILRIKDGLKDAVNHAVKGERLKTELITNVSHDLKTPLTSIINYVELLKREEIQGEKAKEYVEVLEEKAERLKQLIEDLLDASKASSGNVSVELQTLNLNEFVQQAVGEYEEKFLNKNIEVRTNFTEEDIFIHADGKHMWRIAENLMTNVIKYTMPYTRVYIDVSSNNGYGQITIKNVSNQPLDITPEELTQRFVRGDESRTTEGSGLGLSIAQSLTNIQGGEFIIAIDGDLFKVTVAMPIV